MAPDIAAKARPSGELLKLFINNKLTTSASGTE